MNRCTAARRCRNLETDPDGTKHPAIVAHDPELCADCIDHIRRNVIANLTTDAAAMRAMIRERPTTTGEPVHSTPSPTVPLAVEPDRLATEIDFWTTTTAEILSDALGLEPPQPGIHPAQERISIYLDKLVTLPAADIIVWVTGEATAIPVAEWIKTGPRRYRPVDTEGREIVGPGRVIDEYTGIDLALKLWTLHDKAQTLYGNQGRDRDRQASPCYRCARFTLYRDHGTDTIYCEHCGHRWPASDLKNLIGRAAFQMKVLRHNEIETVNWLLAEQRHHRAAAEWCAAEREWELQQIAQFAGHPNPESLLAAINTPRGQA